MSAPVAVPELRTRAGQLCVAPAVADAVTGLALIVLPLLGLVAYLGGTGSVSELKYLAPLLLVLYVAPCGTPGQGFLSAATPWRAAQSAMAASMAAVREGEAPPVLPARISPISPRAAITLPMAGWTLGTLCGALAGSILPASIQAALGVMLYGMFIAIVVPPAKKEKEILVTVLLAMALSTLFTLVPLLKQVSAGISIVICTGVAAAVCAVLFPIPDEKEADA